MSERDDDRPMGAKVGATIWVANDNQPLAQEPVRDVYARKRATWQPIFDPQHAIDPPRERRVAPRFNISKIAQLVLAAALIIINLLPFSTVTAFHPPLVHFGILTFSILAFAAAALWAARSGRRIWPDIAIALSGLSFAGALAALRYYWNIPITPQMGVGLTAIGFLGLAGIGLSRTALILSIVAGVLWATMAVYMAADPVSLWGFPALWALQVSAAIRLKSQIIMNVVMAIGTVWLSGTLFVAATSGHISMPMALMAAFLFGTLLVLAGRNMKRDGVFGVRSLTLWGSAAMILASVTALDWLMSPNIYPWSFAEVTAPGELLWIVIAASAALIGTILLVRAARFFGMSLAASLLYGALLVGLPFAALNSSVITKSLANLPPDIQTYIPFAFGGALALMFGSIMTRGLNYKSWVVRFLGLIGFVGCAALAFSIMWGDASSLALFTVTIALASLAAAFWTEPLEVAS